MPDSIVTTVANKLFEFSTENQHKTNTNILEAVKATASTVAEQDFEVVLNFLNTLLLNLVTTTPLAYTLYRFASTFDYEGYKANGIAFLLKYEDITEEETAAVLKVIETIQKNA